MYDKAYVEIVSYDAETGLPIYASSEAAALRLNGTTPSPTLFSPYGPGFQERVISEVGEASVNATIVRFVAAQLAGKRAGDVFTTPTVEEGFGAWEQQLSVPRTLGPFPMRHEYPRGSFESRYGSPAEGMTFEDGRTAEASLTVVGFNETTVQYRNAIQTGQTIRLRGTGWPGVVLVDGATDTFTLRVQPEAGTLGNLVCNNPALGEYDFKGSFKVVGLNETAVHLAVSSFPFPHLVERPVYLEIRVLGVQRLGRLTLLGA